MFWELKPWGHIFSSSKETDSMRRCQFEPVTMEILRFLICGFLVRLSVVDIAPGTTVLDTYTCT
ncbi:hypothetical protein L208DRAFT_1415111 [Tricholoma matsutake]|nr:hypothetical protein L208DRAFT_1415111 [Tricholoma matsutake 945]